MAPIILLFGILPGVVWLLFYLQEDTHREPAKEIFYAFVAGTAITVVVLGIQNIFSDVFAPLIEIPALSPLYLFMLAGIEEFFKFSAAYLLISRSKYFNMPIDAMIYMIIVALGFATVENIGALQNQFNETAMFSAIVGTATLRFIGATLLHPLASAIVGYYWAKGLIAKRLFSRLAAGLFIATSLHASFNFLVLQNQEQITYPVLLLVLVAFFVMNDFEKLRRVSVGEESSKSFERAREESM